MCSLGLVLWEVLTQQRVYAEERIRYGKDDYLVSLHMADFDAAPFSTMCAKAVLTNLAFAL